MKQRCGDVAMECPGQDHQGKIKKEQPKLHDSNIRRKETDAPDWHIRGGTSSNSRRPRDWMIEGELATRRNGLPHPGQDKKKRPQPRGLGHQGKSGKRPGQDRLGRNKQEVPPPPGLKHPGESGGQKRRRREAEAEVEQRVMESCPDAAQRTTPWRCSHTERRTRLKRCSAAMMLMGPL